MAIGSTHPLRFIGNLDLSSASKDSVGDKIMENSIMLYLNTICHFLKTSLELYANFYPNRLGWNQIQILKFDYSPIQHTSDIKKQKLLLD